MSKTWFTSDTHFGHADIIRHCNRLFASVEEMDEALIENWNAVVSPGDDVWHLGDFAFRNAASIASYAARLNGIPHLIWGNHDTPQTCFWSGWASSQPIKEMRLDGHRIVLCHYAMRVWNQYHRGTLHMYGHSHGRLQPELPNSCDVGVDAPWTNYRPVSLEQVLAHMQGPAA